MTDRIAVLTCDTDWASDAIVREAQQWLLGLGKPVTWFVTSPYPFLGEETNLPLELAPHPNLDGRDPEAELATAMELTPGALSFRAHALHWSSRLRPLLRKHGIRFSSSAMMYLQPGIRPYPIGHTLTELPLFWMDAFHLEYCALEQRSLFDLPSSALRAPGLKVLDVHPLHLVLNTQNQEHYLSAKGKSHEPGFLTGLRRPGPGITDLVAEMVQTLERAGYEFVLLRDTVTLGRVSDKAE